MKHFYHNILGFDECIYPEMSSSWLVKCQPEQEAQYHIHKNSIFSGVLYLNVNKDCGNLSFRLADNDDRTIIPVLDPPIKTINIYNNRSYSLNPRKGLLVLFLSTISHKIEKNRSNEDRISIAFNYFLKGKFTEPAGGLNLK
jgi:uncharacterized protein (TIGR02466 family)